MTHVTSDYPVQPRVGANLNLTSHQQRPTPPTYLPGTTRPVFAVMDMVALFDPTSLFL